MTNLLLAADFDSDEYLDQVTKTGNNFLHQAMLYDFWSRYGAILIIAIILLIAFIVWMRTRARIAGVTSNTMTKAELKEQLAQTNEKLTVDEQTDEEKQTLEKKVIALIKKNGMDYWETSDGIIHVEIEKDTK
jgi:hypothetical protein